MDFPGHFEQIFQQLNHQRVHGQLCDCVIVVGGRHFKAHRAVLAACSTHFRALFSVSEGDENVSVVQLDSEVVTAEAFSSLMDMMYTSTLSLGESNVMDVLLAASHLHLNAVVKACKHYLDTRMLPKSALGERGSQLTPSTNPRLRRSFLLQQLGLSLVSSALNEETEEDGGASRQGVGSVLGRGLADQRDAFCPPRRMQKRKQAFSVIRSEADRPWQRPRLHSQMQGTAIGGEGAPATEELLSPDSRSKIVDEDSKPDVVVIAGDDVEDCRGASAQEDVQLPSQSDGGKADPLLLPRKEEYTHDAAEQVKSRGEDTHHMQVVVKSEPISSPDLADETSDITSQAEGSDQVEASRQKLELSPEGSEHSFSEPHPSSELLLSDIKGSSEGGERVGGFMSASGFEHGSVPIPGSAECVLEREPPRFLYGSDSSSSLLLPPLQNLFSGEGQDFPSLRADALLLRPMQDGMPSSTEHLAMEYQRNGMRGVGFPSYRRIAPKIPLGDASSSHSSASDLDFPSQRLGSSNVLPQLTRASADVLSKCKKALSEHNVLVVEGARKYACKICCKTFLTLTDCKKHIRVHTGEKPYACLKCGKRFSQSSHLYKHSKTTCIRWQNPSMANALL